jgi:ribosome maturation factor RimP
LFVDAEKVYRDIPEELRALIEPVVESAGLELVDVLITRGRRPWLLRVTIDTPEGNGRVPVERCAEVSREVETNLDSADAVPAEYRLEVSSPGLDRLLAREKDFTAARGSEVWIETRRPLDASRRPAALSRSADHLRGRRREVVGGRPRNGNPLRGSREGEHHLQVYARGLRAVTVGTAWTCWV